jgi:hypothetical protein
MATPKGPDPDICAEAHVILRNADTNVAAAEMDILVFGSDGRKGQGHAPAIKRRRAQMFVNQQLQRLGARLIERYCLGPVRPPADEARQESVGQT